MSEIINQAREALTAQGVLAHFMPLGERTVLGRSLLGEEGEGIAKIVLDMVERIKAMPFTGETRGQGEDAIVYLHYFGGSVDAWVTEKDIGSPSDEVSGAQLQATGLISLGYEPEFGYVSIQELIDNGIELDLYWTPKPLKECRA